MELFADILATAIEALKNGRTLLYPTDTIWGIGCDAANGDAVERIYAIKERDHIKAMGGGEFTGGRWNDRCAGATDGLLSAVVGDVG